MPHIAALTAIQTPAAALAGYLQLSQALAKSSLSAVEREYIALAVSQVNGCDYCLAAHTFFGEKTGLSPEEIQRAREGSLNALTVLTRQVTQGRGHLNDEQIAAARAAGFSDAKLIEVVAEVAWMTLSNYVNNIAGTNIDFPPGSSITKNLRAGLLPAGMENRP
jgi:AhpD family alkylhydroperoxidase